MSKTEKGKKNQTELPGAGAKPAANQRGAARLAAVQALYQMDIADTDLADILSQFALRQNGEDVDGHDYLPADLDFLRQIVAGVLKHQLRIDPVLNETLNDDWHLSKIDSTLRAILRAAAFELLFKPDIPQKVVINEYLDVSEAFFEGEVPAMVNAVLDKIAKNRPKNPK